MFVIMKGAFIYVSKPGSKSSYTNNPARARKFKTKEDAEADRCPENERVVDFERVLDEIRS